MSKRLTRWALAMPAFAVVLFSLAGHWRDPWLWSYMAVWAAVSFYALSSISDDLARERFKPRVDGADTTALAFVRLAALAHLVIGPLDNGRLHLTAPVPTPLRVVALGGMALAAWLVFRSMIENHYFSPVVRIQRERGHHLVDSGPYGVVRHPGYAGMIAAVPLSALALGSWVSLAFALAYSGLILRRVVFEDGFLRQQLEGYSDYTRRVPSRLIPGVW